VGDESVTQNLWKVDLSQKVVLAVDQVQLD